MRRRACHVKGERKTSSICHCHNFGAFAALGFTNGTAPLFAGANVPSIKASRKSSLPRSRKSSAKASNMASNPLFANAGTIRDKSGTEDRSGKSLHGTPVRRIQRTPFLGCCEAFEHRSFPLSRTGARVAPHYSLVMPISNFAQETD